MLCSLYVYGRRDTRCHQPDSGLVMDSSDPSSMPYNPWYTATYQPILEMANWGILTADIEKKIIAVFSWMPQTVMSITHSRKPHRCKWEIYSVEMLRSALDPVDAPFAKIAKKLLTEIDASQNRIVIENLYAALFPILGSVAASKYMHFSAPHLLPMWDETIREDGGYKNSVSGYFDYLSAFRNQLNVPKNYRKAIERCPDNAVRGWDMECMRRR